MRNRSNRLLCLSPSYAKMLPQQPLDTIFVKFNFKTSEVCQMIQRNSKGVLIFTVISSLKFKYLTLPITKPVTA